MSRHDEMTRRIVRVIHRVSDRVCLEYDVTHLTPAELSAWVKSVEHYWDNLVFRFEFPDRNAEDTVRDLTSEVED